MVSCVRWCNVIVYLPWCFGKCVWSTKSSPCLTLLLIHSGDHLVVAKLQLHVSFQRWPSPDLSSWAPQVMVHQMSRKHLKEPRGIYHSLDKRPLFLLMRSTDSQRHNKICFFPMLNKEQSIWLVLQQKIQGKVLYCIPIRPLTDKRGSSFKVNSALLSRCRVFVLQRLSEEELQEILSRALDQWRQDVPVSFTEEQKKEEKEALSVLAVYSDGDGKSSSWRNNRIIHWFGCPFIIARNAINTLEVALSVLPSKASPLSPDIIKGKGSHMSICQKLIGSFL